MFTNIYNFSWTLIFNARKLSVDFGGRFYEKRDRGIACVGAVTKKHKGCALIGAEEICRKNEIGY